MPGDDRGKQLERARRSIHTKLSDRESRNGQLRVEAMCKRRRPTSSAGIGLGAQKGRYALASRLRPKA
eukprot:3477497-Pleurochrysis_carterae.AAC.3